MWHFVNAVLTRNVLPLQRRLRREINCSRCCTATWRSVNVLGCVVGLALSGWCTPGQAGEWTFRRSYFSHGDRPGYGASEVVRSQGAYREPIMGGHPRFAIRGGWRNNTIIMQNGASTDRTFIREHWYDLNY